MRFQQIDLLNLRKTNEWLNHINEKYGDLLFDYSQSLLWNSQIAPEAFRAIFKKIKKYKNSDHFEKYERAWVISIATKVLKKYTWKNPVKITPAEQVMLDSNPNPLTRLKFFDSYYHRLPFLSQVALLLRYKYNVSLEEVGAALYLPVPSLSLRIKQSLNLMEEWIWEKVSPTDENEKLLIAQLSDQSFSIRSEEFKTLPFRKKWMKPLLLSNPKKAFQSLPLPMKWALESLFIVVVIFSTIHYAPLIQALYQQKVDERLQKLITAEDAEIASIPLQRGRTESPNEMSISDSEYSQSENESTPLIVGRSEIWRFNIKTDSPAQMRLKIIKSFQNIGLSNETAGLSGIEAPGGIQFDILVPQSSVAQIKKELETQIPTTDKDIENFTELFTWYKNRSKKPIPTGMARVVIWLSQI